MLLLDSLMPIIIFISRTHTAIIKPDAERINFNIICKDDD